MSLAYLDNKTQLRIVIHYVQSFVPGYLCVVCNVNPTNEWSVGSHQGEKTKVRSPTGAVMHG